MSFGAHLLHLDNPIKTLCSRSVTDSTLVFGTISSGSNPDGSAKNIKIVLAVL